MDIAASNRVIARNGIGQFIRDCEGAATRTVQRASERGAKLSKTFAPIGHKPDPRTIPLRESIFSEVLGRTSAHWVATARHALPIEFGAGPHDIPGNPALSFFWEAAGRMWIPASEFYGIPGLQDIVHHPGNAAQPYLRPAYNIVMGQIMSIAKSEYPG